MAHPVAKLPRKEKKFVHVAKPLANADSAAVQPPKDRCRTQALSPNFAARQFKREQIAETAHAFLAIGRVIANQDDFHWAIMQNFVALFR
jgi:hypothetical protein